MTFSMKLLSLLVAAACALALTAGCKPKPKAIPEIQRKQAANLVSEAQFALTLRDYARAEPLLAQATKLCPDTADYWLNLGVTRRRLGDKSGAKTAYENARAAFRDDFELDPDRTEALLQEIYTLALLGRPDDARTALEKGLKKKPNDRALKAFADGKQLDRLLEDPGFRDVSL